VPGEGEWWLNSSEDVRQTCVGAYVLGFKKEYGSGCLKATEVLPPNTGTGPENNPRHMCLQQGPNFPESTASITSLITEFYQRYPNDRDLYVEEIIASLGAGETLDRIHESHHPALAK
jgi:hypothetical protein